MRSPDDILSERQKDFFGYGGAFGCLITLTCLVQHILITREHWITYFMFFSYIFLIVAFFLMALQKSYSPILLIIGACLAMVTEYIFITNFVFSLIIVVMLVYTTVMLLIIYSGELHLLLRQKEIARRQEEEQWRGKI